MRRLHRRQRPYELEAMENVREVEIDTPFGPTSDKLILGSFQGTDVALYRHGRGTVTYPRKRPYRANIYALKKLGVEFVVSVSAVGSLREEFAPGHLALPDQYVDRTSGRVQTFSAMVSFRVYRWQIQPARFCESSSKRVLKRAISHCIIRAPT